MSDTFALGCKDCGMLPGSLGLNPKRKRQQCRF